MKKITFIGAESDLGVHIEGTKYGPKEIFNNFNTNFKKILLEPDNTIQKSQDKYDLKKNEVEINKYNKQLYNLIKNDNNFCITIGGDHSISIGSALASLKKHKNLGLIWIDAHLDYNTFETTITGNIHGLPLATLNGLNEELSEFHNKTYFNPKKTVVVGYRAYEENAMSEINNTSLMGVTIYTTKDIKEHGVEKIMDQAFSIAGKDTDGIHVSFDLDVIDPTLAKGVSIKEENGLNMEEVNKIIDYITNQDNIKSFDLVEYNPLNDTDKKTLEIATNILSKIEKTSHYTKV